MREFGKSDHSIGNLCRDGRPYAHPVCATCSGAVDARITDGSGRQSASAEQSVEVHVYLC